MEIFLLWLDDLDDLVAALRMRWHSALGFFIALALFALTVLTIAQWPGSIVVALFATAALGLNRLRLKAALQLKTDP